ncbi:MAG: hypothetical protein WCT05_12835 [Lentisphaeria bacterium]
MNLSLIALAYIDFGSGSMLLQASLTGLFTITVFSRQLKNWCVKQLKRPPKNGL